MNRKGPNNRRWIPRGALWLPSVSFFLGSCAGNLNLPPAPTTQGSSPLQIDQQAVANLPGARLSFHFADYFTLTQPRSDTSCAGDLKNYYHPFSIAADQVSPLQLPMSQLDPTMTVHPAFIKNIAVDITNANAQSPLNLASACSLGSSSNVPPPSSCASFDYGAIGGLPTNMGGTVLLLGGISDFNYNGIQGVSCGNVSSTLSNRCDPGLYSLGVKVLPASAATNPPSTLAPGLTSATTPISTWANLSAASTYTGPRGLAGAAIAFDTGLARVLTFSGTTPLANAGALGPATATADSWSYDIHTQAWNTLNANSFVDPLLQQMQDNGTLSQTWQKPSGARALFGYVPVQGYALSAMSSGGGIGTVSTSQIDFTDRLFIVGGYGSRGYDTRRFNPTYGPDWVDVSDATSAIPAGVPVQWLDSYPTQQTFNQTLNTGITPAYAGPAPAPSPVVAVGLSIVPARNNASGLGQGYLFSLGGFSSTTLQNSGTAGGALEIFFRNGKPESRTGVYNAITNSLTGASTGALPAWSQWNDASAAVPWYGGANVLPGFSLLQNEIVYFGGSNCQLYMSSSGSTNCASPLFNNPGKYYQFGTTPSSLTFATIGMAGTIPQSAGMSAARGLDGAGNIILVGYGGATSLGIATDMSIYYLVNNAGTPTWVKTSATGSSFPPVLVDGAMTFSHVSRKFYLFGGMTPGAGSGTSYAATWELSVSGTCTTAPGSCTFTWRSLNTNGLSCYPSCPQARRQHRMVEVNYYNRNPGGTVGGVATGESSCNSAAPCSYGIFMEAGTSDGTTLLADRWMFDPTANNGSGHWQLMTELPPRTMSSMTSVDYFVPARNATVHRAVLFGGETGMQNPALPAAGSFVPPTLGDTWIYDFDANTWNRVNLLGKGYASGTLPAGVSVTGAREAYNSNNPVPGVSNELSPPAISGAQMVTRTQRNLLHRAGKTATPLAIPEIFLFGGRQKDGTFLTLDHVYKFCIGTTGEKPYSSDGVTVNGKDRLGNLTGPTDDASCDGYDGINNPYSLSPTAEYKGRWIRKTPAGTGVTTTSTGSFQGAATYDPVRDLVISYGGLTGNAAGVAITNTPSVGANGTVYEYTPPSSTMTPATSEGAWKAMSACAGSTTPSARYGHTLNYDSLNDQLIVIGGYNAAGAPLKQTITYYDGRTFQVPEVWTAKRNDGSSCYNWTLISVFGNSIDVAGQTPPFTGISNASSIFIPTDGYNTGYYTLIDQDCTKAGPIATGDPTINKLLAGGAYFDIDRTQLGTNENLLLNITYIPMGSMNQHSDGTQLSQAETAVFRVHLVKTGLALSDIRLVLQPRYLSYSDTTRYPEVAQTIAVMAPSNGQIRQDQILLPISMDPGIDRIRIERYSGTGILIDASLVRMGKR